MRLRKSIAWFFPFEKGGLFRRKENLRFRTELRRGRFDPSPFFWRKWPECGDLQPFSAAFPPARDRAPQQDRRHNDAGQAKNAAQIFRRKKNALLFLIPQHQRVKARQQQAVRERISRFPAVVQRIKRLPVKAVGADRQLHEKCPEPRLREGKK